MFNSTDLAKALIDTAKVREDSWNELYKQYTTCISGAAEKTCENSSLAEVVSMMLLSCWNDALHWAENNK